MISYNKNVFFVFLIAVFGLSFSIYPTNEQTLEPRILQCDICKIVNRTVTKEFLCYCCAEAIEKIITFDQESKFEFPNKCQTFVPEFWVCFFCNHRTKNIIYPGLCQECKNISLEEHECIEKTCCNHEFR